MPPKRSELSKAQFGSQTMMGISDPNDSAVQAQNRMRASYTANRDKPAVELADKGDPFVSLPTPRANGISMSRHLIQVADHANFKGTPQSGERENYSGGMKGQTVMGLPDEKATRKRKNRPASPGGLARTHTLDAHGNVIDPKHVTDDSYRMAPQNSAEHEAVWAEHATHVMMPASTILHTGQSARATGSHSYISGPLDPNMKGAQVMVHKGVPQFLDGHHTTAEWRGRGNPTFPARVLNLDQFPADHPVHQQLADATRHLDEETDRRRAARMNWGR